MPLLRVPAEEDDNRDEGQGEGGLPDLDLVRGVDHEDDQEPEVGEQGEDHGHAEHGVRLNLPGLPIRNNIHTESVRNMSFNLLFLCKIFSDS